MPEATQYPRDWDSKEAKEIESAFAKEYNARAKALKRAWDYYDGNHKKPLAKQKDGYDDNVIINHIEALTERITSFLLGDGITFDASGDTETMDSEAKGGQDDDPKTGATDEDIAALWQQSDGQITQENIATAGAVEGHCAVRLSPAGEFDEWPAINRIKQSHFSAFWNPFDIKDVLWYRLQAQGRRIDYVRGTMAENGMIDQVAPGWLEFVYTTKDIATGNMFGASGKWTLAELPDRPNPMAWDYDFPPIVDWQNLPAPNDYYGRSDIKSAIDLNDALNFILSNTQRIIKHHADPKTVGTGFTVEQLVQSQVGGFYTVANAEAKIYNLEMQSDGALIQWLTGMLLSGLWESGGMVDPQTMKDRVGDLTNFGLRVLFANAIQKTEKKRLLYGEAFEKIAQYGLELAGRPVPEKVVTVWPDTLPQDDALEVQTLTTELEKKIISMETYRDRRGYDNEKESKRLAGEGTNNGDIGAQILSQLDPNRSFNRGG